MFGWSINVTSLDKDSSGVEIGDKVIIPNVSVDPRNALETQSLSGICVDADGKFISVMANGMTTVLPWSMISYITRTARLHEINTEKSKLDIEQIAAEIAEKADNESDTDVSADGDTH